MVNLISEFSLEEENQLLQYIIKHEKYQHLHEEEFWKEIEKLNLTKATWQNLKHHFENKIIHKLQHPWFKLKKEEIDNILRASSRAYVENKIIDGNGKNNRIIDTNMPPQENIGKKIIVITRRKHSTNIYPNYRTQGHKRILVSRHSNPSPDMTYPEPNPDKPKKTIVASLCAGKKKEIFVVRPKDEEPFERYGTISNKQVNKPPKKLICFSHNVS